MEEYLREVAFARKSSTENRSRQILSEALPYLDGRDIRQGILDYLSACRERGNDNHTLCNKLVRLGAFYNQKMGIKLKDLRIPKPEFVVRMPEICSQPDMDKFFAVCDHHRTLISARSCVGI